MATTQTLQDRLRRMIRGVSLKWLALLAVGNQLLKKSGGRQSGSYLQSRERRHALRKMSTPYGMGEASVLGKLFFILNSPAGWDAVGGTVSQRRTLFYFPAVFTSSVAMCSHMASQMCERTVICICDIYS